MQALALVGSRRGRRNVGRSSFLATSPLSSIKLDRSRVERLSGFTLTPSRDLAENSGPSGRYVVRSRRDGKPQQPAQAGEFANIANARLTNRVRFGTVVSIIEIGAFAAWN